MKKLLLGLLISFSLNASYIDNTKSEFDIALGGGLDIKNSYHKFKLNASIGGAYTKFLFNYGYGSLEGVGLNSFRPAMLIEIPIHFGVTEKHFLAVTPIIDFGPKFSMGSNVKVFDFIDLGFGAKCKYYFNDTYGVSLTPFHMSLSFARYINTPENNAIDKSMMMDYDIYASFFIRW
jgi:hypothetical protein